MDKKIFVLFLFAFILFLLFLSFSQVLAAYCGACNPGRVCPPSRLDMNRCCWGSPSCVGPVPGMCWYNRYDPKPSGGECCDISCTGSGWTLTPNDAKCGVGEKCNTSCTCVTTLTCAAVVGGDCMSSADCFGISPPGSHTCNANPYECVAPEGCCCVPVPVCGNGIEEAGEECDGADLSGQTCVSLGFTGGVLACKADCTFNTSGCFIFDFSLSNSGNITVWPGGSSSNTITVDYTDGTGTTVNLSASGLPAGTSYSFVPNSCTGDCTITLTISTPAEIGLGTYPITVSGIGGGLTRTTTFDLLVVSEGLPLPPGGEICNNGGIDDDGDGLADCADPDCATNLACVSPPPTECKPAYVLLVIDRSGTMGSGSPTRLNKAKTAAKSFIDLLLPAGSINRAALVSFETRASINHDFTDNATSIKTTIEGLAIGNCTNYEGALRHAITLFSGVPANLNKVMIFLTDAEEREPNTSETDPTPCGYTAAQRTHHYDEVDTLKAQGVTNYVISIVVTETPQAKYIATSPAHYYKDPGGDDLEAIYRAIFLNLNDNDKDGFLNAGCSGGTDWNDNDSCIHPVDISVNPIPLMEGIKCGACPPTKFDDPSSINICSAKYYSETNTCAINCNDNRDNDQDGKIDIEDTDPGGCPAPAGLVPCGRLRDAPETAVNETSPCTLCHLFVLSKNIIDFMTLYIIIPLGILMLVVGGTMFLTAAGDPGRISGAKKILTAAVIGLVIIFAAWVIVNTIVFFASEGRLPLPTEVGTILGRKWNEIICPVDEAIVCTPF